MVHRASTIPFRCSGRKTRWRSPSMYHQLAAECAVRHPLCGRHISCGLLLKHTRFSSTTLLFQQSASQDLDLEVVWDTSTGLLGAQRLCGRYKGRYYFQRSANMRFHVTPERLSHHLGAPNRSSGVKNTLRVQKTPSSALIKLMARSRAISQCAATSGA
jgi:hypothetical protein